MNRFAITVGMIVLASTIILAGPIQSVHENDRHDRRLVELGEDGNFRISPKIEVLRSLGEDVRRLEGWINREIEVSRGRLWINKEVFSPTLWNRLEDDIRPGTIRIRNEMFARQNIADGSSWVIGVRTECQGSSVWVLVSEGDDSAVVATARPDWWEAGVQVRYDGLRNE